MGIYTTPSTDILIIGGGLAGLTCAIHLAREGMGVTLVEKKSYPFHRVCGEYISNEVLPYLRSLGIDPQILGCKAIQRFQLTAIDGGQIHTRLPLGAFSVSRYTFDHYMAQVARTAGVKVLERTTAHEVAFKADNFQVHLSDGTLKTAKVVIGAFGKRANQDRLLNRQFFAKRSPYIGVKYHRLGEFSDDLVALHNFHTGYCGVSKIESDLLNVCYLTTQDSLKQAGSIAKLEQDILFQNPHLKHLFLTSRSVFDQPFVINEISFANKELILNHILMVGDAAGLITPLCGNGMAMAIHGAKLLSEAIIAYFYQSQTRNEMEKAYNSTWCKYFSDRLNRGRWIQSCFQNKWISKLAIDTLHLFPSLLPMIIRQTHGKPLIEYTPLHPSNP